MVRYSMGFLVITIFTVIFVLGGIYVYAEFIANNMLYIITPLIIVLALFRAFMFQLFGVVRK
jgi:hypothetical protein